MHNYLAGDGTPTQAQFIVHLCKDLNCTPLQAIDEMRHNPFLPDIIEANSYASAFNEVERWRSMSADAKKGANPPDSYWHRQVAKRMARGAKSMIKDQYARSGN